MSFSVAPADVVWSISFQGNVFFLFLVTLLVNELCRNREFRLQELTNMVKELLKSKIFLFKFSL